MISAAYLRQKLSFSIESRILDGELDARPSTSAKNVTTYMEEVYLMALEDIYNSIRENQNQTIADATKVGPLEMAKIWAWNSTVPPALSDCMHEIYFKFCEAGSGSLGCSILGWRIFIWRS